MQWILKTNNNLSANISAIRTDTKHNFVKHTILNLIFIKFCFKISQKTKRNYCYFLINYIDNVLKSIYPSYREDVAQTCWGKGVEVGIIISTEWSTLHFFAHFSVQPKSLCAHTELFGTPIRFMSIS